MDVSFYCRLRQFFKKRAQVTIFLQKTATICANSSNPELLDISYGSVLLELNVTDSSAACNTQTASRHGWREKSPRLA